MTVVTKSNSPHKVSAGVTESNDVVFSGGSMYVLPGGLADFTTVSSGGFLTVSSGGTAGNGKIGGVENLIGFDFLTTIIQGGTAIVSSGGVEISATISAGGVMKILKGGTVKSDTVNSGTLEATASGGVVIATEIDNTGLLGAVGANAGLLISSADIAIPMSLVMISSGGSGGGSSSGSSPTSGLLVASGGGAHVDLDNARVAADMVLSTSGGNAMIDTVAGTVDILGGVTLTSGSLFKVTNASVLKIAGSPKNSGTISVGATSATAEIDIIGSVTLSGGGKVQLSSSTRNLITASSGSDTLINAGNTIVGAGYIGDGGGTLTFINSGTVDATGSLTVETLANPVSNSGSMEATGSGTLTLTSVTVDNSPTGLLVASGSKAKVLLDEAVVSGGVIETQAKAVVATASATSNSITGAEIVGGSLVEATSGGTMFLESATLDSGATAAASGGGQLIVISTTVASGAVVETGSGGTAILADVDNLGTLFASGAHSLLTLLGPVSGGGILEIDNGTALFAGSEATKFQAGGSGTLELLDDVANAQSYKAWISGFGQNTKQTIDLVNVASAASVSATYMSANAANTSGTLTVSSGGVVVAAIDLIGTYTTAKFKLGKDANGDLAIVDPPVAGGTHAANLDLFGQQIASSLVRGGGVTTGTPAGPTSGTEPQPLLQASHS